MASVWPLAVGTWSSNPQCKSGAGVFERWPPVSPIRVSAFYIRVFLEGRGLPWTPNPWQGLRTGKPGDGEGAALLPKGLILMGGTSIHFLKSPTRCSTNLM